MAYNFAFKFDTAAANFNKITDSIISIEAFCKGHVICGPELTELNFQDVKNGADTHTHDFLGVSKGHFALPPMAAREGTAGLGDSHSRDLKDCGRERAQDAERHLRLSFLACFG